MPQESAGDIGEGKLRYVFSQPRNTCSGRGTGAAVRDDV